jgi:hypothetical protein
MEKVQNNFIFFCDKKNRVFYADLLEKSVFNRLVTKKFPATIGKFRAKI